MRERIQVVGLTGGIGSGKTTVAHRFFALGATVLDADAVSRELLEPNGACVAAVAERFGRELLRSDGGIRRRELAAIVFSDEAARAGLNAIIHPAVREAFLLKTEESLRCAPNRLVVWDVPLLFEVGWDADCGKTVAVICDAEARIRRTMARDGVDRAEVERRIAAQMSDAERAERADFTIDNSGTVEALFERTDAVYRALTAGDE